MASREFACPGCGQAHQVEVKVVAENVEAILAALLTLKRRRGGKGLGLA